ncbi:Heat-inducible transcription repressor HrcA [Candidatus Syntrophocurvum alkaliphilum]|uniref:Heat-inducible transcription repressor HrcA n=1 Tax=Candidatus Syntrophocurvum alkaliphilum TaxID=2293317 RepID=A0A6I6DCP2_9FIRM|nr:heat-inducible transcriptional repressor HrcA [Candidatus Syntrophocurvum alkaliphilum]QGT99999.1 Heat-inducible transcription repressor HrcA [Candidatus Syntrophocurvum alkaliphilum]
MILDDRKKSILESIIKDYVNTAEPVGSRAIKKKHNLKISAATVRNEMADLEDMGYLEQPHTSAGRIPSELGFRYFVDCMMEKETLCNEEIELLHKVLTENIYEWNEVVQKVGQFISQITRYTSFIIVPSVKFSKFKFLQLMPLSNGEALLLIVTEAGLILHRKIDVPEYIGADDLKIIGEVFSQTFKGKSLNQMSRNDMQTLRNELLNRRQVIDTALEVLDNFLTNSEEQRLIVSGSLNILNEPEFKDIEKLKRMLSILDEDGGLIESIPNDVNDEVNIKIGKENEIDEIKEMSLVFAGYKTSSEMGKIGLIGPVRMEYWKAAGTIESVRAIVEQIIKERF